MALPDPELELLQELLADDPGADVFVTVGEELMRRDRHAEAVAVLTAGVDATPDEKAGWRLLALAAQRDGQNLRALAALTHCDIDRAADLDLCRAEVMALEGSGQLQRARAAAEVLLRHHPGDIVGEAVVERLSTPAEDRGASPDPLVTVQRAEEYVAVGRIDRAIRVYRRLLHRAPDDPTLGHRLRELLEAPFVAEDDLSEDLTAEEGVPPPSFAMPAPLLGITALSDEAAPREEDRTDPNVDLRRARERLEAGKLPEPAGPTPLTTPVRGEDERGGRDPDTDEVYDDDSEEMRADLLLDEVQAVAAEEDEDTVVIAEEELVAVDEADSRERPNARRRSLFRR